MTYRLAKKNSKRLKLSRIKLNGLLFFMLVLFFVFAPTLKFFHLSSFLPKVIFIILCFVPALMKAKIKIAISPESIILFLNSYSLLLSFIFANTILILPLLFYSLFYLLIISLKHFPDRIIIKIVQARNLSRTDVLLGVIFAVFPASIILQFIFPEIFYIYNKVIYYDEITTRINIGQIRYSGLISGIGAGATTALSNLYILFLVIYFSNSAKTFWNLTPIVLSFLYLLGMGLTGTTGFIHLIIFSIAISIFKASRRRIFFDIFIIIFVILVMYFVVSYVKFSGFSYFRVFLDQGWIGLIHHKSIYNLLSHYNEFDTNLSFAISSGGLLGSPNAIYRFQLSDIGIVNQIHIYGIVNFVLFNIFLLNCLIKGLVGLARRNINSTYMYVHAGLFATAAFSMIFQLKEFVAYQGTGGLALIILLLIYSRFLKKNPQLSIRTTSR
jgi:hypothetical protein